MDGPSGSPAVRQAGSIPEEVAQSGIATRVWGLRSSVRGRFRHAAVWVHRKWSRDHKFKPGHVLTADELQDLGRQDTDATNTYNDRLKAEIEPHKTTKAQLEKDRGEYEKQNKDRTDTAKVREKFLEDLKGKEIRAEVAFEKAQTAYEQVAGGWRYVIPTSEKWRWLGYAFVWGPAARTAFKQRNRTENAHKDAFEAYGQAKKNDEILREKVDQKVKDAHREILGRLDDFDAKIRQEQDHIDTKTKEITGQRDRVLADTKRQRLNSQQNQKAIDQHKKRVASRRKNAAWRVNKIRKAGETAENVVGYVAKSIAPNPTKVAFRVAAAALTVTAVVLATYLLPVLAPGLLIKAGIAPWICHTVGSLIMGAYAAVSAWKGNPASAAITAGAAAFTMPGGGFIVGGLAAAATYAAGAYRQLHPAAPPAPKVAPTP